MNLGSRMTSISAITVMIGMMKKAASRTEKDARMEVMTMDETMKKRIRIKAQFVKNEIMVIPTFGIVNERHYYGYPVIALAFGWLCFRAKIEFGVRVVRF